MVLLFIALVLFMDSGLLSQLIQAVQSFESVALVTVTKVDSNESALFTQGQQCLVWLEPSRENCGNLVLNETATGLVRSAIGARRHQSLKIEANGTALELFVEVHRKPPHLIIVGAGHIAVPLAEIGTLCGFSVTVLDDRPQYANQRRFPHADQVLAAEFLPALRTLRDENQLDQQTFVTLVTRGHQYDVECLAELIDDDLAYIGMIGSKRRIRAVFDLLRAEKGIEKSRFANVYAPIGLNLGAQTPAEIAVSIVAEIINVIHEGSVPSYRDELQAN